jgi:hypothetical protein
MSLNAQVLDSPVFEKLLVVEAELNYLTPMVEKPVNYTYEPPTGIPRHNSKYETRRLPIKNARPLAQNLSLDREGFAFAVHRSNVKNFYDDSEIQRVYYPEADQLLKSVTGATSVVIFDHTLRNAQRLQQGENLIKEPVKRVHNDFTAKSGYTRAYKELAVREIDNIDELLQQRFAVVNIWRPIALVQESPLAVCDAQSIAPTDLVASDLVYSDRVGETYAITYNPTHRWFYFPQMQRDEVVFIKCFDSAENGQARFDDPTTPSDAPPGESIELRAFIFYSTY